MIQKKAYEKAVSEVIVFNNNDKPIATACSEGITDTMGSTITCAGNVFGVGCQGGW